MNVEKFLQIRFASTAVRRIDGADGEIVGNLTLMGQIRQITIKADLVGVGSNIRGPDHRLQGLNAGSNDVCLNLNELGGI